jgi:hypothetical protein
VGQRDLGELVGNVITHSKVGACEVLQVLDVNTAKASLRILDTNEVKTFVISPQFFTGVEDYKTNVSVKTPVKKTKHIHRKVDLDKYRNHPLVKQIDQQESKRLRAMVEAPVIDTDDDDDSEEVEF